MHIFLSKSLHYLKHLTDNYTAHISIYLPPYKFETSKRILYRYFLKLFM